jgi:hypothetical protein
LSALIDRVATLEVPPPDEEVHDGSNTGGLEDAVYDADGNVDQAATRQNRLHHRLRTNTIGMGALDTSTATKVIVIVLPMILMLRLNLF